MGAWLSAVKMLSSEELSGSSFRLPCHAVLPFISALSIFLIIAHLKEQIPGHSWHSSLRRREFFTVHGSVLMKLQLLSPAKPGLGR